MSNEAAERLRSWIGETGIEAQCQLFEEALAAERRATVEVLQIWHDYWLTQEGVAYGAQTGEALRLMLRQFSAILDAEAKEC